MYDVSKITRNTRLALQDLLHYNLPCTFVVVPLKDTIPHIGDILIGFYADDNVEFDMKLDALLPSYMYSLFNSTEPGPFMSITHKVPKDTFVYAYTKNGEDYVINMIGMQYNTIRLTKTHNLFGVYGYLQGAERLNIAVSRQSLLYVCTSLKNRMATKIQKQWRECISNPIYTICRARLQREALELCEGI